MKKEITRFFFFSASRSFSWSEFTKFDTAITTEYEDTLTGLKRAHLDSDW